MTGDPASIDAYLGTGTSHSVAAGRLSYVLGLQGPCVAVDTACSSSLVAVSQACDSLQAGKCDLAVAGGVNVILSPELSINFSKARMLSADGRCKTFDAAADGYGRGEGCGMVVLKRLAEAERDGDNVLAVIRGTAVNQDGRSGGLTVPNGSAQRQLLEEALAMAAVEGSALQYVEAHGTGTILGDPIEVQALAAALGPGRSGGRPLWMGSVKTNIGHLEGAAGIAGLIKVVLGLVHEEIPPQLHFHQPNPHIPWEQLPVRVATDLMPWPRGAVRRLAGVSSFGFSGTNAHIVLEEAPANGAVAGPANGAVAGPAAAVPERGEHLLTLSAKSAGALQELAGRYAGWLAEQGDIPVADWCFTANTGRSHFSQRAGLVVTTAEQARGQLAALAGGEPAPGLWQGAAHGRPRVALSFAAAVPPCAELVREWSATQPVFCGVLERCAAVAAGRWRRPLGELLADASAWQAEAGVAAAGAYLVQVALAELWRTWGIEAELLLGEGAGAGEYAAACCAGAVTVEEGLSLVLEGLSAETAGGAGATLSGRAVERALLCRGSGRVVRPGERIAEESGDAAAPGEACARGVAGESLAGRERCGCGGAGAGGGARRGIGTHRGAGAVVCGRGDAGLRGVGPAVATAQARAADVSLPAAALRRGSGDRGRGEPGGEWSEPPLVGDAAPVSDRGGGLRPGAERAEPAGAGRAPGVRPRRRAGGVVCRGGDRSGRAAGGVGGSELRAGAGVGGRGGAAAASRGGRRRGGRNPAFPGVQRQRGGGGGGRLDAACAR
jgi:acyl transferase domain-containing protein